jgi:hypothetical protein
MPPGANAPPGAGAPGGEEANKTNDIDLGVVQLQGDGTNIRMANDTVKLSIPNTQLAIRIDKPSDLKLFNNEKVGRMQLEGVQPVDLLPQPDGSWRGTLQTGDGRRVEVMLQKVEG